MLGLLLPKADGAARTVRLMTTLTRLWEAVQVDQAHEWKERGDRSYYWVGKAKGVADSAWMTALRAESAYKGPGFCAAGSVQNLQITYEHISGTASRREDRIPPSC